MSRLESFEVIRQRDVDCFVNAIERHKYKFGSALGVDRRYGVFTLLRNRSVH